MTTLENSYCVPRTVEEWRLLGHDGIPKYKGNPTRIFFAELGIMGEYEKKYAINDVLKRKPWLTNEIPVPRFLDLLHDRIVPWRLEEVGWVKSASHEFYMTSTSIGTICAEGGRVWRSNIIEQKTLNITTFTDLLTLIRMLTPPSNA